MLSSKFIGATSNQPTASRSLTLSEQHVKGEFPSSRTGTAQAGSNNQRDSLSCTVVELTITAASSSDTIDIDSAITDIQSQDKTDTCSVSESYVDCTTDDQSRLLDNSEQPRYVNGAENGSLFLDSTSDQSRLLDSTADQYGFLDGTSDQSRLLNSASDDIPIVREVVACWDIPVLKPKLRLQTTSC